MARSRFFASILCALCSALCSAHARADTPPVVDVAGAVQALYAADHSGPPPGAERCVDLALAEQVGCFIELRYKKDPRAARIAKELYEKTGTVCGLLPEQDFDGDYRGMLHFVPELPVQGERHHLSWLSQSLLELEGFYAGLQAEAQARPPGSSTATTMHYRWRPKAVLFFRSVKRKTPSAIAADWVVSYNLSGSLFKSKLAVQNTLVHELFHLNDQERGYWSRRALAGIYDRIVARCGMKKACLAPYAPDSIVVVGGTYYAFMPDNGVIEYAADLAKRYYVEESAAQKKKPVRQPFKCQTPENAEAWKLLVDEFFSGIDHTPPCKTQP